MSSARETTDQPTRLLRAGSSLQVVKNRENPAIFDVCDYQYDIDARPTKSTPDAPAIVRLHILQSAKDAGLVADYKSDKD